MADNNLENLCIMNLKTLLHVQMRKLQGGTMVYLAKERRFSAFFQKGKNKKAV